MRRGLRGGTELLFRFPIHGLFRPRPGLTFDQPREPGAPLSRGSSKGFEAEAPMPKPPSPVHNNIIGRVRKYKLDAALLICFNRLGKVERRQFNLFVPVSDGIV